MVTDPKAKAAVNLRRVLLGGLVAGTVYNVAGITIAALLDITASFSRLGFRPTPMAGLLHLGMRFGYGLLSVFLYAAIRPRFGPGPRTALVAGLIIWLAAYLPLTIMMTELEVLTMSQAFTAAAWGALEALLATAVGAYLYHE